MVRHLVHSAISITDPCCQGLVLTHTVFLVYMVALKKDANIGLAAFLIVFTVIVKVV